MKYLVLLVMWSGEEARYDFDDVADARRIVESAGMSSHLYRYGDAKDEAGNVYEWFCND